MNSQTHWNLKPLITWTNTKALLNRWGQLSNDVLIATWTPPPFSITISTSLLEDQGNPPSLLNNRGCHPLLSLRGFSLYLLIYTTLTLLFPYLPHCPFSGNVSPFPLLDYLQNLNSSVLWGKSISLVFYVHSLNMSPPFCPRHLFHDFYWGGDERGELNPLYLYLLPLSWLWGMSLDFNR